MLRNRRPTQVSFEGSPGEDSAGGLGAVRSCCGVASSHRGVLSRLPQLKFVPFPLLLSFKMARRRVTAAVVEEEAETSARLDGLDLLQSVSWRNL